ncbi:MAG: hypothetical protein QNK11_02295 [Legionella sp.]|nr:hypothetical protein [Legionella sp.]
MSLVQFLYETSALNLSQSETEQRFSQYLFDKFRLCMNNISNLRSRYLQYRESVVYFDAIGLGSVPFMLFADPSKKVSALYLSLLKQAFESNYIAPSHLNALLGLVNQNHLTFLEVSSHPREPQHIFFNHLTFLNTALEKHWISNAVYCDVMNQSMEGIFYQFNVNKDPMQIINFKLYLSSLEKLPKVNLTRKIVSLVIESHRSEIPRIFLDWFFEKNALKLSPEKQYDLLGGGATRQQTKRYWKKHAAGQINYRLSEIRKMLKEEKKAEDLDIDGMLRVAKKEFYSEHRGLLFKAVPKRSPSSQDAISPACISNAP